MKHVVVFNIDEDNATGEYGLIPVGCEGFNAFWDGVGIFHDVFEHWFENKHKYFIGEAALNRGGECAAMGAAMYYWECLGVSNRPLGSYHYFMDSARMENEYALKEAITQGYMDFGSVLESNVPYQKQIKGGDLEYEVEKLYEGVQLAELSQDNPKYSKEVKDSVTLAKLRNLYRWGYRMAERLVPDKQDNQNTCYEFIEFFNKFCRNNTAESFAGGQMEVIVRKDKGIISWKAFILIDGERIRIKDPYELYLADYLQY